jgi:hypothetical protein
MNISGLVCAISSRLWGLPPRIDNSFFIFFHKFLEVFYREAAQVIPGLERPQEVD